MNYADIEQLKIAVNKVFDEWQRKETKLKQPKTTVTVWKKSEIGTFLKTSWYKSSYSFPGTPNIDEIIKKLEKGVFAVKVKCSEQFALPYRSTDTCYIWQKIFGEINGVGWSHGDYFIFHLADYITDSDIEAAIAAYFGKQKSRPEFHLPNIADYPI